MAILRVRSRITAICLLLLFLAMSHFTSAWQRSYQCSGNTQWDTCNLGSDEWRFNYCESSDDLVYAGYTKDDCCLSNREINQRRDSDNETGASQSVATDLPRSGDIVHSSLVPRACILGRTSLPAFRTCKLCPSSCGEPALIDA